MDKSLNRRPNLGSVRPKIEIQFTATRTKIEVLKFKRLEWYCVNYCPSSSLNHNRDHIHISDLVGAFDLLLIPPAKEFFWISILQRAFGSYECQTKQNLVVHAKTDTLIHNKPSQKWHMDNDRCGDFGSILTFSSSPPSCWSSQNLYTRISSQIIITRLYPSSLYS